MVGIIQEQHPARARLFMQWQEMDWPLLVDSLDLLDVGVVPLTILLDEAGMVVAIQPDKDEFARFLAAPVAAENPAHSFQAQVPDLEKFRQAARDGAGGPLRDFADALVMWGGDAALDEAVAAYGDVLALDPQDGRAHFRLGVTYRKRHDSGSRRSGDFSRAVTAWGRALEIDPNQYIWRRRIQQYGPRLSKPYPFYGWVAEARRQIVSRGEVPVMLPVEPAGAELVGPARVFTAGAAQGAEPDPEGRIARDDQGFIRVEQTLVPAHVAPGEVVRIHLELRPDPARDAHWNNEAEDLTLWIQVPDGWKSDKVSIRVPSPRAATSEESRRVEFELQTPASFAGEAVVPAYALYNVCEGVDGTCLYRRLDIPIQIRADRQPSPGTFRRGAQVPPPPAR